MSSIFFTGSSGTGKSSTAELLGHKLNMKVVDGISRNSPFEIHTLDHQKYMSRNVAATCKIKNRIFCRTPLDVWAYSEAFKINNRTMDGNNLLDFLDTDPTLIYFPPYWKPKNDGFRPTSISLNSVVDDTISDIISRYNVKHYKVLNESVENRVLSIINFLEEHNG